MSEQSNEKNKAKILLVEDDYALALGAEYSLKAEGYEVFVANNYEVAREQLGLSGLPTNLPDIILLDVMLPDGNGFDLCREIREHKLYMPILFLTAVAEEVNIVQGLELGADDYITKPYRVKELLSRIHVLLRRQRQYQESVGVSPQEELNTNVQTASLCFQEYRLDLEQYRLYYQEKQQECTPSEFRLLKELMTNHGRVVTREQLMERLWDIDGNFIDDNTLSVYVKRLRDKFPGLKEQIVTVRGVGYEFQGDVE